MENLIGKLSLPLTKTLFAIETKPIPLLAVLHAPVWFLTETKAPSCRAFLHPPEHERGKYVAFLKLGVFTAKSAWLCGHGVGSKPRSAFRRMIVFQMLPRENFQSNIEFITYVMLRRAAKYGGDLCRSATTYSGCTLRSA